MGNKGNYLYWEWHISLNVLSENIATVEAISFLRFIYFKRSQISLRL